MDKVIDARFERVEKALASLIESVSKYHPHAKQALDLHEADNDLAKGLDEVQTHQNNHLHLQQLRATTSSLDTQIRETLQSLATTRKDITTTQITVYPDGPKYPVKYDELLNYARRISKTTLPPAALTNGGGVTTGGDTPAPDPNASMTTNPNTPGANGPQSQPVSAAPTPSQSQTPGPSGAPNSSPLQDALQGTQQTTTTSGATSLPDGLRNHLDPHFNASFIPWPNEFQIRSGAMAVYQDLADKGIDPRGYDPQQIAEVKRKEEEERKAREEQEKLEIERKNREYQEKMEKIRREQQEAYRRDSVAAGAGASSAGKSKQFQFTSLMDDDDDDE
ncbi:mediator of RNA polymerase II transcription subunit 4 [Colletotrichum tofieldiae]|uniref:Mediator of RNA polymerase II transcription subunit 4 n=1 Tax=Colletotrichum tofieldiae TaxID=708197 RepID=A0A161WIJ8_9PEZI|nr:Mediator of RNA polymerase II transcription subunit 4 [Colletotrichum tofieldiae]GKT61498.1 mediator of RNA polymerase II transcription subunit 4 [Colletotrichum tofieldiae]GKT70441.1 mediator of RNA polymerase II transcription subunit 4 [Colletotrichum tofieldiae]